MKKYISKKVIDFLTFPKKIMGFKSCTFLNSKFYTNKFHFVSSKYNSKNVQNCEKRHRWHFHHNLKNKKNISQFYILCCTKKNLFADKMESNLPYLKTVIIRIEKYPSWLRSNVHKLHELTKSLPSALCSKNSQTTLFFGFPIFLTSLS